MAVHGVNPGFVDCSVCLGSEKQERDAAVSLSYCYASALVCLPDFVYYIAYSRVLVKGVVVPLADVFIDAAAYENRKYGAEEEYKKTEAWKTEILFFLKREFVFS